ncbi:Plasmodium exported protein (PHISTa), unknown, putative [Plasmodium gaboni]|uniref:Plasmodium RESA N-terminal domain-containing protein n=1 Tax=Plasmodium gaboni TaxID=647221 RepID=A0ABY0KWJ5_9APIC|nr:Plasmodium exported protein (PHISTa), unknown, putative [Plasmodium gaboni]
MNKKNCIIFPFYRVDVNPKGKFHYISFKLLCLSLYIIGFYYVFLNTSLENKGLENVINGNIYERNLGEAQTINKGPTWKRNLKLEKEDVNKTKSNGNIKSNEEKVEENKHSTNNDNENNNVENKSNISIGNINYNDISKKLTEKELFEVLNSFEECPSKEDLRNIWNHTLGVVKGGFDDIQSELNGLIQKYLDNDVYNKRGIGLYESIWKKNLFSLSEKIATEEVKYTKNFYNLINGEHTLDDILKFIYSYLEHFKTLKKELHQKQQKELLENIAQNSRSFKK